MKKQMSLFIAMITLWLGLGCNNNNESTTVTYPRTFVISGAELGQVHYRVVTATGFEILSGHPNASGIEDGIREELDDYVADPEVNEIELLTETTGMLYTPAGDAAPVNVEISGNEVTITLTDGSGFSITYEKTDDFDEMRFCNIAHAHTYFDDFFNSVQYSPLDFELCYTDNLETVFSDYAANEDLVEGDTAIVAFVNVVYSLQ